MRDFLGSLSRRMKHFDIKYVDYNTTVEQVRAVFQVENDGPGQLLGYRAMHKKIREKHGLAVPRGLVYDVMTLDYGDGLQRQKLLERKREKGSSRNFHFSGKCLSWTIPSYPHTPLWMICTLPEII